jgi:diacylglycerol kinase (ATP)
VMRIIKAFGYSVAGLKSAFASEAAFRQELALCAVLMPMALMVDVSVSERALLLASLFLVLMVEIINTAFEAVIERISNEIHPVSKRVKDLGSAAVLLALVNAGVVWAIVLWG